ncbi:crosslink repair DNA glycosylase YcaQ family protein [Salipiger sp. 1_MG-2023]|uniref:winged helix-turn-helix domain-containing protein n=1 Tax=Salipiger sp. 1_MG-2023 TaxID=3062665 RepID=UPI0026E3F064|nr:crosslink repair DNA glycosylase YcaQ family protein [Salipiger sp. 1_MG-2023]MDO6588016.1 crosslink repair DNA glycosylase YcaQ family protein [Salipiger sp. 1_MG-2023]
MTAPALFRQAPLRIANCDARRLWLAANGLSGVPSGADALGVIRALGFVQLDTIQVVSRAHHHILWSRAQSYREPMLDKLLRKQAVFEHFTHDASALPMEMLPLWQRQFDRMRRKVAGSWYVGIASDRLTAEILARIRDEGPLCTRDFDTVVEERAMWQRPPHKKALDYLWYAGVLATSHREGVIKYYDLAERVFPQVERLPDEAQIDGLCTAALKRLGVGTLTEIRKFWDATEAPEVARWAARAQPVPVMIEGADGRWTSALGSPDIEERLQAAPPSRRLRLLNPFDPAIRDRARLKRLFGFDYTVEMFVPEAKRRWGYYVYPLLEGDRMVGRIAAKGDRKAGTLSVTNLWWEPGLRASSGRDARLSAELHRFARLAGLREVHPADPGTWPIGS